MNVVPHSLRDEHARVHRRPRPRRLPGGHHLVHVPEQAVTRKPSSRWPSRPLPTPRGIKGKRVVVYIDAIVQTHVPLARINACIKDHQRGIRVAVVQANLKEPVFKTECTHEGFKWWAVSFPLQRRLFLGPPEFFRKYFP